VKFKSKHVEARFALLCDRAKELAIEMAVWAMNRYKIELVFTATVSTKEEDKVLGRVSDTHRTGRAFDIRTAGLPEAFIAEFILHFETKYPKLGAGKLIVNKAHGTGPHLHVQLNRTFAIVPIV
jgi:hypothetical protein